MRNRILTSTVFVCGCLSGETGGSAPDGGLPLGGAPAPGSPSAAPPSVAPSEPPPPPPNRLLPEDLKFEGLFRVPTGPLAEGANASLAYGGAAFASRVVDGQRRFFFTGHRDANDPLVELAAPDGLGQTLETAPTASVVRYWGDIYGGRKVTHDEPDPTKPNFNWTEGLLWDESAQRLFFSYGNWYAAARLNNPVLGAVSLGADGSVQTQGPWRTTAEPQQTRSFAVFLTPTLSAATGGAALGLGGKMQSINASASWGPVLHAIDAPAPDRPAAPPLDVGTGTWADESLLDARTLAHHPIEPLEHRTPRPADYDVARNPDGTVDSAGTQPPQGDVGFWTELDEAAGAVFVQAGGGTRGALVYAGGEAYGFMWYGPDLEHEVMDGRGYDGTGNHAERYRTMLWFVDEADLVAAAEGRLEPHAVHPYARVELATQFPELGFTAGWAAGQPVFAPDEGRLYVPFPKGARQGRDPYPVVAVFRVKD